MGEQSFIHDLGSKRALADLVRLAPRALTLGEVRKVAEGQANALARVELGERWTEYLISLAERGGVGRLERRDGGLVFRFCEPVPDPEDAFCEATGPWPETDEIDETEDVDDA
jgi:hypothetical protein